VRAASGNIKNRDFCNRELRNDGKSGFIEKKGDKPRPILMGTKKTPHHSALTREKSIAYRANRISEKLKERAS